MLFGHAGSGILPFGLNDDNTFRTKGMGGDAVKYLENREIADLTLPDYEFMIMHACMMASVEVAFELRHKTRYLVASEVSLSSVGWPWHENLSYLFTPAPCRPVKVCVTFLRMAFTIIRPMTTNVRHCPS